jgi:N-acetylglucosaminyldiphosphoundecaprenol N-acetyl-beta-D-mannosaminyltransferase
MLTRGTLSPGAATPSGADFTIPDGAYGAEQVSSRSEGPTLPALSDRVNILGVGATPQDLNSAVTTLDRWRAERKQEYVCVVSVHGLVVAQRDPVIRHALNHCGMATEDGMPLVWWSRLAGFREARRVCGSDLLDEVCAFGLPRKFRHYFYGASPKVVEQLIDRLQKRHPGLRVAGYRSPPFRPLTPAEDAADIAAINESEPDFVWVGLGMPKQEKWMVEHLGKINATALIGVGAAFDFHAGTKPRAPVWMQHAGLEWLFRLLTEPRRLAFHRPHVAAGDWAEEIFAGFVTTNINRPVSARGVQSCRRAYPGD